MIKNGFNNVFWGYIVVVFNINLGPINLLPDFLGYFIMALGLSKIISKFENKSISSAKVMMNFLFVYSLIFSIFNIMGIRDLYSAIYKDVIGLGLTIFISIIRLIATFKILSGVIDLYLNIGKENEAESMESSQRTYTVLTIIGLLGFTISVNTLNEYFLGVIAIFLVIVYIYYAVLLNRIRKSINEDLMVN